MLRLVTLISTLVALATAGRLYVKQAGPNGKDGIDLVDGFKLCPSDFSSRGISIVCIPTDPTTTSHVRFYVNDVMGRRESVAPYAIAGDNNDDFAAWTPTGDLSNQKVACVVNTAAGWKENIIATGSFSCVRSVAEPVQQPAPPTPSLSASPKTPTTPVKPYFRVVEAHLVGAHENAAHHSAPLTNNFKFCPAVYNNVISLECVAPEAATYADMFVNGVKQRRENVKPFTMAGDTGGSSTRWSLVPGIISISCQTNAGSTTITGSFECDAVVTPQPQIPTTEQAIPNSAPLSEAQTEPVTENPPAPTSTPTTTPGFTPVGVSRRNCVLIPATSYTNTKSVDWVLNEGNKSLTFRPNDNNGNALPPDTATLDYKFTVPVESHYAITMASQTIDLTEHNDIWITFTDGIDLIRLENGVIEERPDNRYRNLKGPQKSYHNSPGKYVKFALSVDHREHTFSTTNKLKPGVEYTITVGARSTKFQFYGLVMFPCYREQCWIWGDHFLSYLAMCHLP